MFTLLSAFPVLLPARDLTPDEQRTLMTLWCIARSPLMFGGNLPDNDGFTLGLITNDAVLIVNQCSENNRQLFRRDGHVAWVADVPGETGKYVAMFNMLTNTPPSLATNSIGVTLTELGFSGTCRVRDLWQQRDIGTMTNELNATLPPHGAGLYLVQPEQAMPSAK